MSALAKVAEELRSLPPARLKLAAASVHRLSRITDEGRRAILADRTGAGGCG